MREVDRNAILSAANQLLVARPVVVTNRNVKKIARWPFECDALGVVNGQQDEAREAYRKCGISMDFNNDGRAIITGPKQYQAAQRAMGVHDRSGY